jgi:hypothetical protein
MKQLLFTLLLLVTGTAFAQLTTDSVQPNRLHYDTVITVPLEPKFGLQRTATFQGFFYNLETNTLALRWRLRYYKEGEPVLIFGKSHEDREQIADAFTFVDMNGNIIDTTGYTGLFISEIDFYKMIANRGTGPNNATINQLIIQAALRPGRWKD